MKLSSAVTSACLLLALGVSNLPSARAATSDKDKYRVSISPVGSGSHDIFKICQEFNHDGRSFMPGGIFPLDEKVVGDLLVQMGYTNYEKMPTITSDLDGVIMVQRGEADTNGQSNGSNGFGLVVNGDLKVVKTPLGTTKQHVLCYQTGAVGTGTFASTPAHVIPPDSVNVPTSDPVTATAAAARTALQPVPAAAPGSAPGTATKAYKDTSYAGSGSTGLGNVKEVRGAGSSSSSGTTKRGKSAVSIVSPQGVKIDQLQPGTMNWLFSWILSFVKASSHAIPEDWNLLLEDTSTPPLPPTIATTIRKDPKNNDPKYSAASAGTQSDYSSRQLRGGSDAMLDEAEARQLQRKTQRPRTQAPGGGRDSNGDDDIDESDDGTDNGQQLKAKKKELEERMTRSRDPYTKARLQNELNSVNELRMVIRIKEISKALDSATGAYATDLEDKLSKLKATKKQLKKKIAEDEEAFMQLKIDKMVKSLESGKRNGKTLSADQRTKLEKELKELRRRQAKRKGKAPVKDDGGQKKQQFQEINQEVERLKQEKAVDEQDIQLTSQQIENNKEELKDVKQFRLRKEDEIKRNLNAAVEDLLKKGLEQGALKRFKDTTAALEAEYSEADRSAEKRAMELQTDNTLGKAAIRQVQDKKREVEQAIEKAEGVAKLEGIDSDLAERKDQFKQALASEGLDQETREQLQAKLQRLEGKSAKLEREVTGTLEDAKAKTKGPSFAGIVLRAQKDAMLKKLKESGEVTPDQKQWYEHKLSELDRNIEAVDKDKAKLDKKEDAFVDAIKTGRLSPKKREKALAILQQVREKKKRHGRLGCKEGSAGSQGSRRRLFLAQLWKAARLCIGGEEEVPVYPEPEEKWEDIESMDPDKAAEYLRKYRWKPGSELFATLQGIQPYKKYKDGDREHYQEWHNLLQSVVLKGAKGAEQKFIDMGLEDNANIQKMDTATVEDAIRDIRDIFQAVSYLSNNYRIITQYVPEKKYKELIASEAYAYGGGGYARQDAIFAENAMIRKTRREDSKIKEYDSRMIDMFSRLKPMLDLLHLQKDSLALKEIMNKCKTNPDDEKCKKAKEMKAFEKIESAIAKNFGAWNWPPSTEERNRYKQEQWEKRLKVSDRPDFTFLVSIQINFDKRMEIYREALHKNFGYTSGSHQDEDRLWTRTMTRLNQDL